MGDAAPGDDVAVIEDDHDMGREEKQGAGDKAKELKLIHCLLAPEDAAEEYIAIWKALGRSRVNVLEICGGDLQGMLDMLQTVYNHAKEPVDQEFSLETSVYRSFGMFGLPPGKMCSIARVDQLHNEITLRLLNLHLAIEEHIMSFATIIEQSESADLIKDHGESGREQVRLDSRIIFNSVLNVVETAGDLVKSCIRAKAAQSRTATAGLSFPRTAFTTMDDNAPENSMLPWQMVEKMLLIKLKRSGYRRMSEFVMAPFFINKNGQSFNTFAYVKHMTIDEYVEEETSLSKNAQAWRMRQNGTPFIKKHLKDCKTILFPPLNVTQAVFACQDALINLREMYFYFYDAEDPMVMNMQEIQATTLNVLDKFMDREEQHMAFLQQEIDAINKVQQQVMSVGDSKLVVAALNKVRLSIHVQIKALYKDVIEEADEEEQLPESPESDVSMAPAAGSDFEEVTEDTMGERVFDVSDMIQAKRASINDTQMAIQTVQNIIRVDPPTDDVVAEMFVDQAFPWEALQAFLKPIRKKLDNGKSGGMTVDWRNIETRSWEHLFRYQRLPENAIDIAAYVMNGRMIFPPLEYDSWQVVGEYVGMGGTGKSIIAKQMEAQHSSAADNILRTGIMGNNIENPFGPSAVLNEHPEERVFSVIHKDVTPEFAWKRFPIGQFLVWAANETAPWPVKNKSPLVAIAPHTTFFGNLPLQYTDIKGNVNRRRITTRMDRAVKVSDPTLEKKIMGPERLPLLIKSAIAYRTFAGQHESHGIWNAGILPEYFHEQRQKNCIANQPLVAFLSMQDGESILLDKNVNVQVDLKTGRVTELPDRDCVFNGVTFSAFKSLVNEFTQNNKGTRRVKWLDIATIKHQLQSFSCDIVTPSKCLPAELPANVDPASTAKHVVGLRIIQQSAPDLGANPNNKPTGSNDELPPEPSSVANHSWD